MLVRKCKNAIIKLNNSVECWKNRRKLKNTDFTIISNNCWGGRTYQKFGIKYYSPTIGLFILGHDFVKFCSDFENYLKKELVFIPWEASSYYTELKNDIPYPIAKLGDIEIYFMHYKSEQEARKKWNRRLERVNLEHILFKLSQREGCSKKDIETFMNLPLKSKLCLAYDKVDGAIYVPKLKGLKGDEYSIVSEFIDDISILNNL